MAEPVPSDVLTAMMNALEPFVPAQVAGLPRPSLTFASAEFRAAGIGNCIGVSTRGSIGGVEQHAVRVQAVARFSLWGFAAFDVDQVVNALTTSIFAKRSDLQAQGFLKLSFDETTHMEQTRDSTAWRRFADYDTLYEFPYEDVGDAPSLILPIAAQETTTGDSLTITGNLGRWDDKAAPTLPIRGQQTITELAALSFFANPADPPTGSVTITRTFDGAPAPANAGTLPAFLSQITSSAAPARNVFVSFASVSSLLAQFTPDTTPFSMGDWDQDGIPDSYVPTHLVFPAPLALRSVTDRLELSYSQPKFDRTGVVYLRALRRGG
ncbi:hypothetical protein SAMN05444161_7426 [Rhizobiales bacterium GAS191]|jgi:hypothetical protein|nr:hypothetical protein SAMN05444161_7426 [Rhizobiales bacterium GAS191]